MRRLYISTFTLSVFLFLWNNLSAQEADKYGLIHCESPVPQGKITYITGYGLEDPEMALEYYHINNKYSQYLR